MENVLFLIFPLGFFALWFSTMSLLFLFSSWRKVMAKNLCLESVEGKKITWSSIVINRGVRYQRSVDITVSPKGLYVYPMKFLQVAWHRPFLVPWSAIASFSEKQSFMISYLDMHLKDGTTFWLDIRVKSAIDELGIVLK